MLKIISFFFIWSLFGIFLWLVLDSGYHFLRLKHTKRLYRSLYPTSFFKSFLVNFPKMFAIYLRDLNEPDFKEHGLYLFCGEQGSGKSMSMTYNVNRLLMEYPDVKIYTNYGLMIQDDSLKSYKDLLYLDNQERGIIFCLDEIQGTFSSRNWKDFPPDMINVVCQNRKSHRVIFGTAQSINMVDKTIRLQTRRFITCHNFLNIVQVCLYYKPEFDFEGNLLKSRLKKIQFFMQDESLRYQYNTFDLIKSLR